MQGICVYKSPIGDIAIEQHNESIVHLYLSGSYPEDRNIIGTPLLTLAKQQLKEYFLGNRKEFNLPLEPHGTEFQKKVWNALSRIPFGTTVSYKQVAEMVGRNKACRAVGMANNKNPIAIFIPCHRVIGSDGSLVGYGGGMEMKKRLLELEGVKVSGKYKIL